MSLVGALLVSGVATLTALGVIRIPGLTAQHRHSILFLAIVCGPLAWLIGWLSLELGIAKLTLLPSLAESTQAGRVVETVNGLVSTTIEVSFLGYAYVSISVLLLLRVLFEVHRTNQRVPSESSSDVPLDLPTEGIRAAKIRRSRDTQTPYTWGVVQPIVVVPANWDSWPQTKQRAALAHELSHIQRFDVLTLLSSLLVCCSLWLNPLIWMAHKKLRQEAECACDDRVVESGVDPNTYATYLVEISKNQVNGPAPAMSGRSSLHIRIEKLLDPNTRRTDMTKKSMWMAVAATFTLAICSAATGMGPPSSTEKSVATKLKACGALAPKGAQLSMELSADWSAGTAKPFQMSWTLGDNNDASRIGEVPTELIPFAQCVNEAIARDMLSGQPTTASGGR